MSMWQEIAKTRTEVKIVIGVENLATKKETVVGREAIAQCVKKIRMKRYEEGVKRPI